MNIAIIGTGNVGSALGSAWAATGHAIFYGTRNAGSDKVRALLGSIDGEATAGTVPEAVIDAEVVVLATPWGATRSAVLAAGKLEGKIVIDCTNPLIERPEGFELELGYDRSGGELVAEWATGASVFKTLNQTSSENMADASYRPAPVMFVAGDDAARKPLVLGLVEDLGFEAVDAGPIQAARYLEPLAMLFIHLAYDQGLGLDFALALVRRERGQTR